ncbi:tetratricopeptide repeat protein, partial [Candidatus Poribacteria bacterium]|nr:tetratricopeptide repeat protein [Candidatus Poribacteria bacterium]
GYPPQELQNLARIFAYRGNHAQAESLYNQALVSAPADGSLHFDLAETLWAQGREGEAVGEYSAAIAYDSSFATYFTASVHAEFFAADMSPDDARQALDKALAIDDSDDEAHVLYAQVETAVGRLAEAVGHYERARSLAPNRPDIYFPLGDIYYARGEVALARVALTRGVELNPTQTRQYAVAGAESFGRGDYGLAAAAYGKHGLLFPDDIDAVYHLARSLEGANDSDGAIAAYERVRAAAPRTEDALVRLAALYRGRGDAHAALDVLTELVGIEPGSAAAHFARGEILADLDDATEATLAFERVVALMPEHIDAHFRLGELYEEHRDGDAIRSYGRVIGLAPERPGAYFRLGAVHLRLGDGEAVIDAYGRGLQIQPRRGNEQYVLAQLLDQRDRLDEAVEHYGVAVDVKDDDAAWQYDYGRCAHRVGERTDEYDRETAMFVAADGAYTASILLSPTPGAHYYRGILRREHRQIGDSLYLYSEVASDFEQVLAADPEHVDARYMLGLTYVDMEQDSKARQTFRRLLEIDAAYPNGHAELGAIAEREQEYQQAIDEYEAELRVAPESARAHFRAGYLYQASRGDPGTASEHLALAVDLDPSNADAHVEYGRVLYQLDRLRAAADQFERALKLDGRNLTANYNLAMVYQYMDKRALAIERFRYLLTLELPGEWKAEAEGYLRRLEGQ